MRSEATRSHVPLRSSSSRARPTSAPGERAVSRDVRLAHRDPRRDRKLLALRVDRRSGRVDDRGTRRAVGLFTDEDAADRGGRLQPRRGVDDVARDHRLAERGARVHHHERLAGVHGDADLQVELRVRFVDRAHSLPHRERGANCTLGVVTERRRRAEQPHDRVADELLDDTAERLDLSSDGVVVRPEQRLHVLGVEPLGPRREADQVDEDHADETAFLIRCLVLADERLTAGEAEPRDRGVLLAASGAEAHG